MKRLTLIYLAILAFQAQFDLDVSQFTMMEHSCELFHAKFPYIQRHWFGWNRSLKNNVETINGILKDVTCILNWNGNSKDRVYIDRPEILVDNFIPAFVELATSMVRSTNHLMVDYFRRKRDQVKTFAKKRIDYIKKNLEDIKKVEFESLKNQLLSKNETAEKKFEAFANSLNDEFLKRLTEEEEEYEFGLGIEWTVNFQFENKTESNYPEDFSISKKDKSTEAISLGDIYKTIEVFFNYGLEIYAKFNEIFDKTFMDTKGQYIFSSEKKIELSEKIKLEKTKEFLFKSDFKRHVDENFGEKLKNNPGRKNYKSLDDYTSDMKKMVVKRLQTILATMNLDLFKKSTEQKFKYGIILEEEIPSFSSVYSKEKHYPAILMAFNSDKLEPISEKETPRSFFEKKTSEFGTSKLVVQYFKEKETEQTFGVICARFHEDKKSTDLRKELANEITNSLRSIKPQELKTNFIIMVNFNDEIEKISDYLKSQVNFFSPEGNSKYKTLDKVTNKNTFWLANNYDTEFNMNKDESNFCCSDCENQIKSNFFSYEPLKNEIKKNKRIEKCFQDLNNPNPVVKEKKGSNQKCILANYSNEDSFKCYVKIAKKTYKFLKKSLEKTQIKIYKQYLQNILKSLFVKRQTDFIFLDFQSLVRIMKSEAVPKNEVMDKYGLPCSKFSSDHRASIVTLRIDQHFDFQVKNIYKDLQTRA